MNKKPSKPEAPAKRTAPARRDAVALGALMQARITKPAAPAKKR